MRSYFKVVCECGHEGSIKLSENDQPYSSHWENYSLENLNGNSFSAPISGASWEVIFKETNATCPKCKRKLNEENLKK